LKFLNYFGKLVVFQSVIDTYIQNNIFKMEHSNYTLDDMTEYDAFLTEIGVDKSEFIEHLNIVTSPESQLCDFNAMLSYVRDIDGYSFKYIVSSLNREPIYYRIWYFYFKFLLLDNEPKDNFYKTYIKKLLSVNELFDSGRGKDKNEWDVILRLFYKLVNDEPLQFFMDCFDNYGQYIRLDLSKKDNIGYKKDKYINNYILDVYVDVIENFGLVHFCHNIIYCISDKYGYQKIENSNGLIDFQQRFHSNIDKFIIAWNAMSITYFSICSINISSHEKFIENIPIDRMGCPNRYGYFDGDKVVEIKENEKYILLSNLFESIFLSSSNKFNEKYDDLFRFYLEKVLKYDIYEDKYKLYFYRDNGFNEKRIEFKLEVRYIGYLQSKIVNGLDYIHSRIYTKLKNINIDDEDLKELKTFIKKIFKEFNYHKLISF
jgi:hypothetical protein